MESLLLIITSLFVIVGFFWLFTALRTHSDTASNPISTPNPDVLKYNNNIEQYTIRETPCRMLNYEDITAIRYIENYSNAYTPFITLTRSEQDQAVYCVKSESLTIIKQQQNNEDTYHIKLSYNNSSMVIYISPIIEARLLDSTDFNHKKIEFIINKGRFILLSIEGVISYRSLYKKIYLHSEDKDITVLSTRTITKAEKKQFMPSIWRHPLLFMLFLLVGTSLILSIVDQYIWLLIMLSIFIPFVFYVPKTYRSLKRYTKMRPVHCVRGDIHFDDRLNFYIGNQMLKFPYKWHEAIWIKMYEEKIKIIKDVQIEAILVARSYADKDALNMVYQPFSLQSDIINISQNELGHTRNYSLPLIIFMYCAVIAYLMPFSSFLPEFYYSIQYMLKSNASIVSVNDSYNNKVKQHQFVHVKGKVIPTFSIIKTDANIMAKGQVALHYQLNNEQLFLLKEGASASYQAQFAVDNAIIKAQIAHIEQINRVYQKLYQYKEAPTILPSERGDLASFSAYTAMMTEGDKGHFDYLRFDSLCSNMLLIKK